MIDIYKNYATLTSKQKTIFDYMVKHPEEICYITLSGLSERLGVSQVSVLRLCRALGLSGFLELKELFRGNVNQAGLYVNAPSRTLEGIDPSERSDHSELLGRFFANEQRNLASQFAKLDAEELFSCAEAVMRAGEVVVFGHDASKIPADYLVHRLNYLRIKATAVRLGDDDTVKTILPRFKPKDCGVIFAFPPYHPSVKTVAHYLNYRNVKTVTITDSPQSPAITENGFNFLCATDTKFFFNSLTGPMSLIGVLTSCIAVQMGSGLDRILEEEQSVNRFFMERTQEPENKHDD